MLTTSTGVTNLSWVSNDSVISDVFFQLLDGLRSVHPYLHCSSVVPDPGVRGFYRVLLCGFLLSS